MPVVGLLLCVSHLRRRESKKLLLLVVKLVWAIAEERMPTKTIAFFV